MDKNRTIIIVIMDVLLLAEMVFGIWLAHGGDTEAIAWNFSKVFVPLAVATVVGARLAVRRWAPPLSGDIYCPVGIMGPRG
jgi:hypothetical protein